MNSESPVQDDDVHLDFVAHMMRVPLLAMAPVRFC